MNAKTLKSSILQMAVQGKLVPQDPRDEPASVLLERIREERCKLIAEGKAKASKGGESVIYRDSDGSYYEKRGKGDPVCIDNEIPFEIPESWEWVRVVSLGAVVGGGTPKTSVSEYWANEDSGIPWLTPADMKYITDRSVSYGQRFISAKGLANSSARLLPAGSVIMSSRAPIGYLGIAEREIATNQGFKSVVPYIGSHNRWIITALDVLMESIKARSSGTTFKEISGTEFGLTLMPLPPEEEQERIVAKVEELSPFIEQYGVLEDERMLLETEIPERLRKSILQQAVQGKLVPQDPSDEPASVLLERIRDERRKLVAEGKTKVPKGGESVIYRDFDGSYYEKCGKNDPVCIDDEIPFDIPESWEWERLSSLVTINSGLGYKKENLSIVGESMIRVLRGGNITMSSTVEFFDNDVMISEEFVDSSLHLKKGMLITPAVTSLQNVGKMALIERDLDNVVVGGFVFYLVPLIHGVYSSYLLRALSAPTHIDYCCSIVKKSGQAFYNLSKLAYGRCLVPVPPLAEQGRIVAATNEALLAFGEDID